MPKKIKYICTALLVWMIGFFDANAQDISALRAKAEAGDAQAQADLGDIYLYGKGIKADFHEAVKWYISAIRQGNNDAKFNLGRMYEKGLGVGHDRLIAMGWYNDAAENGHGNAQAYIGWLYKQGNIIPPYNKMKAYMWLSMAAKKGNIFAMIQLDRLTALLTAKERARGQKMVDKCIKRNYKNCWNL